MESSQEFCTESSFLHKKENKRYNLIALILTNTYYPGYDSEQHLKRFNRRSDTLSNINFDGNFQAL